MNLRDWFAPYRMNSELIVDIDGKIYPACMNYLVEDEEVKQQYCLGQLGQEGLLGIDHYEELRISNDEAIGVFFQVNNIIPNYDSNIKTGMMINRVVKDINDRLAADGVNVMDYLMNTVTIDKQKVARLKKAAISLGLSGGDMSYPPIPCWNIDMSRSAMVDTWSSIFSDTSREGSLVFIFIYPFVKLNAFFVIVYLLLVLPRLSTIDT
jgi:hypothetical protein